MKPSIFFFSFLVLLFLIPFIVAVENPGTAKQTKGWNVQELDRGWEVKLPQTQKGEICLYNPTAKSITDIEPSKNLYDSKGKIIGTLSRQATSVSASQVYGYCYIVDKEGYLKFGEHSTIVVYDDENRIQYNFDWGHTNITLYRDDERIDDLFVYWNTDEWKFGAEDLNNPGLAEYTYVINSTERLVKIDDVYRIDNVSYYFPRFYNFKPNGFDEYRHWFDFHDICMEEYSDCKWEYYNDSAVIHFTSDSNIDPAIENVSACMTLTIANQFYQMNKSITYAGAGSCITIQAENVTLDCKGFTMTASGNTAGQKGVYNSGYNTSTVENCRIDNFGANTGGCAFVYSWDGTGFIPEFAISDYAILKQSEFTSHGILNKIKKEDKQYHIVVNEVVEETQYIDSLKLLRVNHPKGTWVVPESSSLPFQEGTIHVFDEKIYPDVVVDEFGDSYWKEVVNPDELYFVSNMDKYGKLKGDEWSELYLNFSNVEKGNVRFVIRGKDTGLATYAWREALTLAEGLDKEGYDYMHFNFKFSKSDLGNLAKYIFYRITNQHEEDGMAVANWLYEQGYTRVYIKQDGEWVLTDELAFGNVAFYHTFSGEFENENGLVEMKIVNYPYLHQIDEVYLDDGEEQNYEVEELPVKRVGLTNSNLSEDEIKAKLMYDDEDYFVMPHEMYAHFYFDAPETDEEESVIVKAKAYAETYTFKTGDLSQFQEKNLTLFREIINSGEKTREIYPYYFREYYDLVTNPPRSDYIPLRSHTGIHFAYSQNNTIFNNTINPVTTNTKKESAVYFLNVSNSNVSKLYVNQIKGSGLSFPDDWLWIVNSKDNIFQYMFLQKQMSGTGMLFDNSTNNLIQHSNITESPGVNIYGNLSAYCLQQFDNVTGNSNKLVYLYNGTGLDVQNVNGSDIFICQAFNSTFDNLTSNYYVEIAFSNDSILRNTINTLNIAFSNNNTFYDLNSTTLQVVSGSHNRFINVSVNNFNHFYSSYNNISYSNITNLVFGTGYNSLLFGGSYEFRNTSHNIIEYTNLSNFYAGFIFDESGQMINNTIKDSRFNNDSIELYTRKTPYNSSLIFINTTGNETGVPYLWENWTIIRAWWYDAKVNYTNGDNAVGLYVLGYNSSHQVFSEPTGTDGTMANGKIALTDYVRTNTTWEYVGNYTFNVTYYSTTEETTHNVTQDRNVFDVFTFTWITSSNVTNIFPNIPFTVPHLEANRILRYDYVPILKINQRRIYE